MVGAVRLPRRVHLGNGHVVTVTLVSRQTLKDLNGDEDEPLEGLWDSDTRAIYVLRSLGSADRWRVYWHELLHAVNDLAAHDSSGLNL